MRKDTILIVLGFAVVAAGTYFILDITLERTQPELTAVVPDQPPVVQQQKAANSPKAEELKKAGLPAEEKAKLEQQEHPASAPVTEDEPEAESGADDVDTQPTAADAEPTDSEDAAAGADQPETTSDEPASDDQAAETDSAAAADEPESGTDQPAEPAADDPATASEEASPADEPAAGEPAASSEPAADNEQLVATAVTNVRDAGNKQAEVVGQLMPGDTVAVLEDNDDDWVKIEHENLEGWVFRSLFKSP